MFPGKGNEEPEAAHGGGETLRICLDPLTVRGIEVDHDTSPVASGVAPATSAPAPVPFLGSGGAAVSGRLQLVTQHQKVPWGLVQTHTHPP